MIRAIILGSAMLLVGLFAMRADAESTTWSASSNACVPAISTIDDSIMEINAGAVRHRSGATGTITVYCAVAPNNGADSTPNRAWHTYRTDAGGTVDTFLYKKSTSTGSITQLFQIDSTDTNNVTMEGYQIPVGYTLDWNSYYYYIRTDIYRGTTSGVASFYGARIGEYP